MHTSINLINRVNRVCALYNFVTRCSRTIILSLAYIPRVIKRYFFFNEETSAIISQKTYDWLILVITSINICARPWYFGFSLWRKERIFRWERDFIWEKAGAFLKLWKVTLSFFGCALIIRRCYALLLFSSAATCAAYVIRTYLHTICGTDCTSATRYKEPESMKKEQHARVQLVIAR